MDLSCKYLMYVEYSCLFSVQFNLGSFGAFLIFADLISEMINLRAKRTKIWASWGKYLVYMEYF